MANARFNSPLKKPYEVVIDQIMVHKGRSPDRTSSVDRAQHKSEYSRESRKNYHLNMNSF